MEEIVIHAVGDVLVSRPDPTEPFSLVRGILDTADVVFGNCEAPFSRDGGRMHDTSLVADAGGAAGLSSAGFTVMSCANNHILDCGHEGMLATLDVLHEHGIATAGAGVDLNAARRPAMLATHGGTVAVLAYASYFPVGAEATPDRPGIVTVGGDTIPSATYPICSPGVAPTVVSVPNQAELDAMISDVQLARDHADVVITSFHWGDATRPSVLTDHEWRTARAAIDAGADAVIGHHHHVLRGLEIYREKPIFYGLGNFVWDAPVGWADAFSPSTRERMRRLGKYALRPRPGYPRLPFHPDGRMTVIARYRFLGSQLQWFGFLPCQIDPEGLATPLDVKTEAGQGVLDFVRETCDDLELAVELEPDPDERAGVFTWVRVRAHEDA